ncbi:hypothetical protein WMF39_02400 [Sorangium sp. So ce1504]|uniref:hypothetical protein n=1 Tax=Sorangium sp. So ce1504 TaxID=3133337 RepID=UPI003F62F960
MSNGHEGERTALLFIERWLEQLRTTFVPRRARTLCAHAALDEVLALAESFVRSGGSTRPAIEPADGGHGVHMLGDVALEAAHYVSGDEVLSAIYPKRKQVLHDLVLGMKAKENVTQDAVELLRALVSPLRRTALRDSFDRVLRTIEKSPKEHEAICTLSETIVSELRALGWSDEALDEAGAAAEADIRTRGSAGIEQLGRALTVPPGEFICFVAVSLPATRPPFPSDDPTLTLVDKLPELERHGRPTKGGPFLRAVVQAFDSHGAAAIAHRRVLSTLGALTVFLPGAHIEVASDIVAVLTGDALKMVELQEKLVEEKRKADRSEQARILKSAWEASRSSIADPLHDALRLRHRALMARDSESRLLLLWSSLERMTAGARGYDGALSAAKDLISYAVTFGKLRRDIGDLIGCITHTIAKDDTLKARFIELVGGKADKPWNEVDRFKILSILLGDNTELRKLTSLIYDLSPLLSFRCHELWKALGSGKEADRGKHLANYFERSRERVSRQVGRIYRARNRIAHVGAGAERVRDLVWHAHFYLTQLIAICVHYTESQPRRAQDILLERAGQYRAFLRLLQQGDPTAMSPQVLLRPSLAVGRQ